MEQHLTQILNGEEENYIFPFFWMHEGNGKQIPERVQKIYESGCRALCVESRPHEQFGKQEWWEDLTLILEECKKREMKVWILDDKHFPTGFANDILKEKYPERRKWFLREHHVDVVGPMAEASVLLPRLDEVQEESIVGAVAFRRGENGDELEDEAFLLTEMEQGFLFWDIPEGFYRIFFVIKSRYGGRNNLSNHISGVEKESVQALIEAVYDPHYEHFAEYFGNTLEGFFSDEPGIYSTYVGPWGEDHGRYRYTVGHPGIALPWGDETEAEMKKKYEQLACALPGLWYPVKGRSSKLRLDYMDTITKLWQKNFSEQLGEWCRKHGVWYTGHVVEDMNSHMRLGMSAGHYFRNLAGQDMSGIDIVLHQVLPGFAEHPASARITNGTAGNAFFHYVLPKLASSLSRIEPRMQGKAMCEVFGAYGWAEDTACMKWMMDFLLVRGINRFVPHAFTDLYPDPDCPPHFYAKGNNPQFEGFSKLMKYVNQMSHLLSGADMQTDGAIFYMAEAEWMSSPSFRTMDETAKVLYDAHIDFDILPLDALETAAVEDRKLVINGHPHRFLVIPYAERYPDRLYELAEQFARQQLPVFWIREDEAASLQEMLEQVRAQQLAWCYTEKAEHLRIGHFSRGQADVFHVFWEDVQNEVKTSIMLPRKGAYLRLNLLDGKVTRAYTQDGTADIALTPYQSEVLYFDDFTEQEWEGFPQSEDWKLEAQPELLWKISLLEQGLQTEYQQVEETTQLFSITGAKHWPNFSGKILYQTKLMVDEQSELMLELGQVGGTAKLSVNGEEVGMCICPPYRFDISKQLRIGENEIEIEVANTLVQRLKDSFSTYMQIAPSGILGPVTVYKK